MCVVVRRVTGIILWFAISINTSTSYGDLELRSIWFNFDLVHFENLKRRIKCNLINPLRERLLRNFTSNPYCDFELRSRRFRFDLVYFENLERRIKCNLIWLAISINTSNSYIDFELRGRRFHFDLIYFENLV